MNIPGSIIKKLAEKAHLAPSADNSQPWRLIWDGEFLSISYDSDRVMGKTFPADYPATLLSIGAVVEILIQVATDWKLLPKLELSEPLPTDQGRYARISFGTFDQADFKAQQEHPVALRHSNRLPYGKQAIPENLVRELNSTRENAARVMFIGDCETISSIGSIVKSASEVRFQTEEVHRWLGRSLRFSRQSANLGDGMDVETLGLPPGGKLFLRLISRWERMRLLNKIGIYKIVAAIDAAPIKSAPGLMAILAPKSARGTIDAGRLLARSWIRLNHAGLAAHPYYVIADQLARLEAQQIPAQLQSQVQAIAADSRQCFELTKNETLHMLFRVGYPKKAPRLSTRLPLNDVYLDQSC